MLLISNVNWIKPLTWSVTVATSPRKRLFYPIIEQHLPRFLGHIAEHGTQLPRIVVQEFGDYLASGRLEFGFLRVSAEVSAHLVVLDAMIEISAHVVPTPKRRAKRKRKHTAHAKSPPAVETDRPLAPLSWAERLKRVFKY